MDRAARKQVLLTRIAFERMELRRDLSRVRQATSLPTLVRAAVGENVGRALLGAMLPGKSSWMPTAVSMFRKYKLAATLLAGFAPGLAGVGLKRMTKIAGLASAAWLGWRAYQGYKSQSAKSQGDYSP